MSDDSVIEMLKRHLKSNDWLILAVGDREAYVDHRRLFRIGQTLQNNQEAVTELVEYGHFPAGTIFVARPRPRRRGADEVSLIFAEVEGRELVSREIGEISHRVDWRRLRGLIEGRERWEKRMAECRRIEREIQQELDLDIHATAADAR